MMWRGGMVRGSCAVHGRGVMCWRGAAATTVMAASAMTTTMAATVAAPGLRYSHRHRQDRQNER
jgi:hypothetical protein